MSEKNTNGASTPERDQDIQRSDEPSHDEILAQVEQILSSREFTSSARLQRLLQYIVAETLAGRSDQLKEYTIAIDVFDRDDAFDPQTSSIVRVEASRLRAKLSHYNASEGANDPVQIDLPAGSYVPRLLRRHRYDGKKTQNERSESSGTILPRPDRNIDRIAKFALPLILVAVVIFFFFYKQPIFSPQTASIDDTQETEEEYSIVVLPLRNFSGEPAEDYFSDGMTDALITGLAQERIAHVTSMTSAMVYKDTNQPLKLIAQELGVSHLVEGSVMRVGSKVRITVQLIEAETDRHLWAESYERGMSDILRLQDDVVARIVSSITQNVTPKNTLNSTKVFDVDPDAYEAHLKGRFFMNQATEDGFDKGIAYFKEAIEKEPEYAPSYSGMAACYCLLGGHGFEIVKPSTGMPAAKKAVLEALRLDSNLAEPHAFLGIIRLKYDWDWRSAEESFKRAIEINPSYSRAHIFYSFYLEAMERPTEAVNEAEIARALDPMSRAANINLGWQYLQAGRLEEARRSFERTAELYPNHWGIHWGMGQYFLHQNEYEQAVDAFQRALASGGGHAMPIGALGYSYAKSGRTVEADNALSMLDTLSAEGYVSPYHKAAIYAGLGDNDKALAALEDAYNLRSRSMAWLKVAPEMDNLRADPRFDDLLSRVGLVN